MENIGPDMAACPCCGTSWIGLPVPPERRAQLGRTNFSRLIVVFDHNHHTEGHKCPICRAFFPVAEPVAA